MLHTDKAFGTANRLSAPSQQMRIWHPEQFSDSKHTSEPTISRAVFDHHLETLTSRKQEYEFEYFARLLCEQEICPNLRPQTGPTGGGDSKVDTETYPVAPELAMGWYTGEPQAASERWAFAFSAKKKWLEKVKADVAKIIETNRQYKRIFFVTNQYAPDKSRAKAEDSLTKLTGVAVTILDRSWILEKVYNNNRLAMAVRALNITGNAELVVERAGPRDAARLVELERLDAAVSDSARYDGKYYALAEDVLQSALLARSLERPRSEVEARFHTAARFAGQLGHVGQRLRIAYNHAWTAHWWFDDIAQFNALYDAVEELALVSDYASDLEQLHNLWNLLFNAVARGILSKERGKIVQRSIALRGRLELLAADGDRPNNAAQARTSLALMDAVQLCSENRLHELDLVWGALRNIFASVDGLGDYPVESIYDVVSKLGDLTPESEAFDIMYDDLVLLRERYRGEAESGISYLRRGTQKLKKGRYYDAIRMLGRAETKLIKAEYIDDLVETLIAIGQSYYLAGLKWAARAKALIAVDRLLSTFGRTGHLDPRAAVPLRFLASLEFELGRVPQLLSVIGLYRSLVVATKQPREIAEKVSEHLAALDAGVAVLLMRANEEQLYALGRAPAVLEQAELTVARAALLWVLGGAVAVRDAGFVDKDESDSRISEFFELLAREGGEQKAPELLILAEGPTLDLRTVVLGVEVVARVASNRDSIFLAEAVLAALESFLATSLDSGVFPHRERIEFAVYADQDPMAQPTLHTHGITHALDLTHGAGNFAGATDYSTFLSCLQEVIVHLSLRMLLVPDPKGWLDRIAGDEVGFGRALALSAVGVATRNVFGDKPKVFLSDWIDQESEPHPLKRSPIKAPEPETSPSDDSDLETIQYGEGEPPNPFNPEAGGHADRRVLSTINVPLWDRANWGGVGFVIAEGYPPFLRFGFHDYEAGKAIFLEWRERYGRRDLKEALRITIVRGVDRGSPAAYRVIVSSEIKGPIEPGKMFYLTARICLMEPTDTANLERFLEAQSHSGTYVITPSSLSLSMRAQAIDPNLAIEKRNLHVRDAWTIGDNDPDFCGVHPDDDPIIPEGVIDPPVNRALERLRSMRKGRFGGQSDS